MTYLASDNTAGVSPEVLRALEAANTSYAPAYGNDPYTKDLTQAFRLLFEHDTLEVFPVFNGSASNCTALTSLMKPFEAVLCHAHAHINQDECGMPEFFTGGKVLGMASENGKLTPSALTPLLTRAASSGVHHVRPKVISLTQSTEVGTVYSPQEIVALSHLAKVHNLYLHMDGARFANGVASLGCAPKEITWQAGVDVLSFGGTKNGGMLAEVVIFFDPQLAQDFGHVRKRAGQLASKQRFLAVQMLALLEGGLWLRNAAHANVMAKALEEGLRAHGVNILFPVQSNAVFVTLPRDQAQSLWDKGHAFYPWPLLGENTYRLVTSFQTTIEEIDLFVKAF